MSPVLLDTDMLSEILKGRNTQVNHNAQAYLDAYGHFTFSIITRYEILRGLLAKQATRQIRTFEEFCQSSIVLSLTDEIIVVAANIYGQLHQRGQLVSDADILIAATAIVHQLTLVTGNHSHFERIADVVLGNWRAIDAVST